MITLVNDETKNEANLVLARDACPRCGERDCDYLKLISDAYVRCLRCRKVYRVTSESEVRA